MLGAVAANRRRGGGEALPIPFQGSANVTVSDEGSGVYRLEKAGGSGWGEQGYSTAALRGEIVLKILLGASMADSYVGIASNRSSPSYTGIDWSLVLSGGQIYTTNFGSVLGGSNFAPSGDALWIVRAADNEITVREGANYDTAVVRYTIGADAASFYADSSFYATGATVDVKFGAPAVFQA